MECKLLIIDNSQRYRNGNGVGRETRHESCQSGHSSSLQQDLRGEQRDHDCGDECVAAHREVEHGVHCPNGSRTLPLRLRIRVRTDPLELFPNRPRLFLLRVHAKAIHHLLVKEGQSYLLARHVLLSARRGHGRRHRPGKNLGSRHFHKGSHCHYGGQGRGKVRVAEERA